MKHKSMESNEFTTTLFPTSQHMSHTVVAWYLMTGFWRRKSQTTVTTRTKTHPTITELFNNAIRCSATTRRRFGCTERREQKSSERKTKKKSILISPEVPLNDVEAKILCTFRFQDT
jgi:hypothetical protein